MSQLRIVKTAGPLGATTRPARDGFGTARPIAVFDLDGTLVDTAPDLTASLNHCLRAAGLPEVDLDTVRPHAGRGVRVMLERAYERAGLHLHGAAMEEQFQRFLAHYEDHIADHSTLFPGALAALDRLDEAGITLAVCTNKTERLSKLLIEVLGLSSRFAAICGADTFARRKPDPLHLLGTIEQAGGRPDAAVMIGDTSIDTDAALASGIPSILVDFGYEADERARSTADRVIETFDALDASMLRELLAHRIEGS